MVISDQPESVVKGSGPTYSGLDPNGLRTGKAKICVGSSCVSVVVKMNKDGCPIRARPMTCKAKRQTLTNQGRAQTCRSEPFQGQTRSVCYAMYAHGISVLLSVCETTNQPISCQLGCCARDHSLYGRGHIPVSSWMIGTGWGTNSTRAEVPRSIRPGHSVRADASELIAPDQQAGPALWLS